MTTEFGPVLKEWRVMRRMSQLDLGLSANVSARHISFLETGRARPSRGMILRLCDELAVPRAARNTWLTAAGLAPAYAARDLSDADMAPVRAAIAWTLERHDPYPAFVIDKYWQILDLNPAAARLFGLVGLGAGDDVIAALAENERLRASIVNLQDVLRLTAARLRTESVHLGGDMRLAAAADRLLLGVTEPKPIGAMPSFVPAIYRVGEFELRFLTTLSQFGTTEDIALSEMRLELMYPADEQTETRLKTVFV